MTEEASPRRPCPAISDDMDILYGKLLRSHAIIIACPVYFGTINAQTKVFMDRTEPLLRYSGCPEIRSGLRNKVGAAICVGGNRNGGQETTIQAIHHFYLIHDMIIVGTGPDPTPGCYLGVASTTYPERGKVPTAVLKDELGLKAAAMIGKRVWEASSALIKGGLL